MLEGKRSRESVFQVLLIDNGGGQGVEVQESKQVDFCQVKEHLRNGGSVFITSRGGQKIRYRRFRAQVNYSRSRRLFGFLFRRRL